MSQLQGHRQEYALKHISISDFAQLIRDIKGNQNVQHQLRTISLHYPCLAEFIEDMTAQFTNHQTYDMGDTLEFDLRYLWQSFKFISKEIDLDLTLLTNTFNAIVDCQCYVMNNLPFFFKNIDFSQPLTYAQCKAIHRDLPLIRSSVHPHDIDNVMLRYHLHEQQSAAGVLHPNEIDGYTLFGPHVRYRKMNWLDFNEEIAKRLSVERSISILNNEDCVDQETVLRIEDVILEKILRVDKLYYIDAKHIASGQALQDYINTTNVTSNAVDLIDLFDNVGQRVRSTSFQNKLIHLRNEIADELDCVSFLHQMCQELEGIPDVSANQALQSFADEKIVQIQSMSERNRCLVKQMCISVLHDQSGPSHGPRLRFVCEKINNAVHDSCLNYYESPGGTVSCQHDTFHFYTLNKWMELFCQMFSITFPSSTCTHANIQSQSDMEVIYPRKGFCSGCYSTYKQMQSSMNTPIINSASLKTSDKTTHRFIALVYNQQLFMYRVRFSDQCDMEAKYSNFSQARNIEEVRNELLREAITALKNESNRMRLTFRNPNIVFRQRIQQP